MSELFAGITEVGLDGQLLIPSSFDDCLTYEDQMLWVFLNKQNTLVEGEGITLTLNEDGTYTISSTATGSTYEIRSATPDQGYGSAYVLVDTETGEVSGSKINIPSAIVPNISANATVDNVSSDTPTVDVSKSGSDASPSFLFAFHGLKGAVGAAGQDGQDGVGITSITYKETDTNGNYIYTVNLTNGSGYDITCPIGPAGQGGSLPTGGNIGAVLRKVSDTDGDVAWNGARGAISVPESFSGRVSYVYAMDSSTGELSSVSGASSRMSCTLDRFTCACSLVNSVASIIPTQNIHDKILKMSFLSTQRVSPCRSIVFNFNRSSMT